MNRYKINQLRQHWRRVIDINECLSHENICPVGAHCVSTIGSYQCECNDGFLKHDNGKCVKVQRQRMILRINEIYNRRYSNNSSQEFASLSSRISTAIAKVYKDNSNFYRTEVLVLRNGSVLSELSLMFKIPPISLVELVRAVQNNNLEGLSVEKNALTILHPGSCSSQDPCQLYSKCEQFYNAFYTCNCNDKYYENGTHCAAYIEVHAEIGIKQDFTADLQNGTSPGYKQLELRVIAELTKVFNKTTYFADVIVIGFRNGSVKIDFIVLYRRSPSDTKEESRKVVVATALQEEATDGFIENLQISGDIQLREPPPAPENLGTRDETENEIVVEWDPPESSEYFSITHYVISYGVVASSKVAMVTVSIGANNELLDDLESDTYYIITVHGKNKFGNGDKTKEIQVTTEKESKNYTTLIIVVVVAVVVIIIIFICVGIYLKKRRRSK